MKFDRQFHTSLDAPSAYDFLRDFRNLPKWDPSIVAVRKVGRKPVGEGTRFEVRLSFVGVPSVLDYRIESDSRPERAVLVAETPFVKAVDRISVEPTSGGCRVRWVAEIDLRGPLAWLDPVVSAFFRPTVDRAIAGLIRELGRAARAKPQSQAAVGT